MTEHSGALRRIESHLESRDGQRLFRRAWQPDAPHHVVVFVHGYAEHSGRYDELGTAFAEAGFAVEAFDLRGHGRSTGERCHVDGFAQYLDDVDIVLGFAREAYAGLPIHLMGHSMGGLIVLTHLIERSPVVATGVVTGPALSVGGAPALQLFAAKLLAKVRPTFTLKMELDATGLSRDPSVAERYLADPLVERTISASLANELSQTALRTASAGAEIKVPLLALHGEADPICDVNATRAFVEQVGTTGSRFHAYPELRHEILNEPERDRVRSDILAWWKELSQ